MAPSNSCKVWSKIKLQSHRKLELNQLFWPRPMWDCCPCGCSHELDAVGSNRGDWVLSPPVHSCTHTWRAPLAGLTVSLPHQRSERKTTFMPLYSQRYFFTNYVQLGGRNSHRLQRDIKWVTESEFYFLSIVNPSGPVDLNLLLSSFFFNQIFLKNM